MTRNTRNNSNGRFPGAFAPEEDDDQPISKSQRKRDSTALQKLGAELEALPKDRLLRVPLPEAVADAIFAARKITNHEGKRRQMQFVGKVMRNLDEEEVAAIQSALEGFKGTSKAETAKLHLIERWRDLLLADDANLTKFLGEHPSVDVQAVRNIIRNARKEKESGKPPKYYRELFQAIKTALDIKADAAEEGEPTEPGESDE
ncbi:ribosome biogenesis factor YjgA [Cupriavidus sp. SW-Y-13]|uniref:ribosome biogenesis factor YjgA n=1 Tax=Cupriavidus sp. SW-Y-13 TaxID=2653854 RepID=UPI00271531EF|nr:ribosome biogenesis factor YjgA [Cupriavidus sp. SW-Y-13]